MVKVDLQSLDIPTSKHFWKRQYWHLFLVTLLMTHFLSRWHVYCMFFCTLLLKKPWICERKKYEANAIKIWHGKYKRVGQFVQSPIKVYYKIYTINPNVIDNVNKIVDKWVINYRKKKKIGCTCINVNIWTDVELWGSIV